MTLGDSVREEIERTLASDDVVLFMKGRRRFPQCGFSATVVNLLDQLIEDYTTINVLTSPEIREGIKKYSNWPTIPQLYIKGQFVGGCDIVTEMVEQGELQALLGVEIQEVAPPNLNLSDSARDQLKAAIGAEGGQGIRLTIDAKFRPALGVDVAKPSDMVVESNGVQFFVDKGTAKRSDGLTIDFVDGAEGGFRLDNPNEPPRVRAITPAEYKNRHSAGDEMLLVDVRPEEEAKIASIPGAKLLTDEFRQELMAMPKDTPVVFHCHHGGRSQAAAEYFLNEGFTKVYNLQGGIEVWSTTVDSSIPRY